jgi:hypothetical protein
MHLQAPRRRTLLRRLAWLVPVGALLALPLTALPGSPETAQAAAMDRSFGSWNIHGQFHHGDEETPGPPESRWTSVLPSAMRQVDVLALQEAGSGPPDRAGWSDHARYRGSGVTEHVVNMGTSSRPDVRNIYWGDTGQQRNGLAIVTRETAEEVVQLPVHAGNARPIMGIRLGNDWYFTAHALSNHDSPNDDADIIETVRQFMAQQAHQGQDWLMLNDFNHGPGRLPLHLQRQVIAANAATHQGGNELDYGVGRQQNNGSVTLGRHGLGNSDHSILRIEHQNCRRSKGRDCNAPLPGHTYRYFSQHKKGYIIARGEPSLFPYRKNRDAKDPNFQVEVRYSNAPNRYLLSFGKECIERRADDFHTTTKTCDPANKNQHWELTSNRIHAPNLGPELHPSPPFDALTLDTSAYYWKPEEIQHPSTESDPDRELRKRKRDNGAGQGSDPGPGAGGEGAGQGSDQGPGAGAGGAGAGQDTGKTFPTRKKCNAQGMKLTDHEGPYMCTKKGNRWLLEVG